MKDYNNYSLKTHNTFGIDVKCSRYLEFEDDLEALEVAKILRKSKMPYIIIGGGSNLLLTKDLKVSLCVRVSRATNSRKITLAVYG